MIHEHIRNLRAITEGFKNIIFRNEEVEEIARHRASICSKCEHFNREHPFKRMLEDDSIEEIKGAGCNICECFIPAKVRQMLQGCPEKKW